MKAALARHDELLRRCIEAARGYVFKTVGDAFCAAFETASDAMSAALDCQAALVSAPWEVPGGIRVRMALHTGTAEERDGDYFGQTLNRVARLLSIGYGGQTLVSLVTAELLRDLLPDDVSLQDLGAHRLKDLLRPESVFQLVHRGLRSDFPALKSLDNHPNNLPLQPNPFVGREKELQAVQSLLTSEQVRALTLTGVGGTGKTRLSLQAAANLIEHFPDGVFFVDLSAIDSAAHVIPMIARTLEVRETGARPLAALLQDALRDKRMLLILDNFEQVMKGVPHVVDLLGACPSLKVLVTSREALHIRAERVFRVPPLTAPKRREAREMLPSRISQYEAVSLFVDRATAVAPEFSVTNDNAPAVAEICARLDGLPLAIELAAARVNVLSPAAILERLGSTLKLLSGGAADLPFRQRTLRATIDWSYRLLTPAEQQLFREAAVFSGGCTLEAMEAVCGCGGSDGIDVMDTLASLVDKSLLSVDEHATGKRFVMFESLREYGLELLDASRARDEACRAHGEYYLDIAESVAPALVGPRQRFELDALEHEHDNFRAALAWLSRKGDVDSGLRLCNALGLYWQVRGYLTEGRESCARALSREGGSASARGGVLLQSGALAREHGEYSLSVRYLASAAKLYRLGADASGLAAAHYELGMTLYRQGDRPEAKIQFTAAYEGSPPGDDVIRALAEKGLGLLAEQSGRLDDAEVHFERSRDVFRKIGDDRLLAHAVSDLANLAHSRGDYRQAVQLSSEALELSRKVRDERSYAVSWNNMGFFFAALGEHERALECYRSLQVLSLRMGTRRWLALALAGIADASLALGNRPAALTAATEALQVSSEVGESVELAVSLRAAGEAYLANGDWRKAKDCFSRGIPLLEKYIELDDQEDKQRAARGLARSLEKLAQSADATTHV